MNLTFFPLLDLIGLLENHNTNTYNVLATSFKGMPQTFVFVYFKVFVLQNRIKPHKLGFPF